MKSTVNLYDMEFDVTESDGGRVPLESVNMLVASSVCHQQSLWASRDTANESILFGTH